MIPQIEPHLEQNTRLDFEKHLCTVVRVILVISTGYVDFYSSLSPILLAMIPDFGWLLIARLKLEVEKV